MRVFGANTEARVGSVLGASMTLPSPSPLAGRGRHPSERMTGEGAVSWAWPLTRLAAKLLATLSPLCGKREESVSASARALSILPWWRAAARCGGGRRGRGDRGIRGTRSGACRDAIWFRRAASAARCAAYPSLTSAMAVETIVEARQFAHEIVEAPARRRHFAQREPGQRRRRQRPQEQRQMREIAALGEGGDHVGHGRPQTKRPPAGADGRRRM